MDVNWHANRIRVADNFTRGAMDTPKSHEGRSVPMANRLARELQRHFGRSLYRADSDLVFGHPYTGRILDASKMRERFKAALVRAGVRQITFHELRHTLGIQMAAAEAPLRAIQEWMGHADAKTTEIYRHYAPDPTNGAALVDPAFGAGGVLAASCDDEDAMRQRATLRFDTGREVRVEVVREEHDEIVLRRRDRRDACSGEPHRCDRRASGW